MGLRAGASAAAPAALLAAIVAATGAGQAYWLCVPAALAVATGCVTRAGTALATIVVLAGAGAPTFAVATDRPALWVAVVVPISSVAILDATRARLRAERDGLRDFALTDPLTRIANRRALLAQADHEIARHRRARRRLAVVMVDLDGFKALNDRFGHAAGDDLLRDVAAALHRAMRAQDTVARMGGDEFCVLAPETDGEGARRLAGRVAHAVAGVVAGVQAVRASVGTAVYPDDAGDPAGLLAVADGRLLNAKRELYRERPGRRAA